MKTTKITLRRKQLKKDRSLLPDWCLQGFLDEEHTHVMEKEFGGALWAIQQSNDAMLPMYCLCKAPSIGMCAQIKVNLLQKINGLSFTMFRGAISDIIPDGENPDTLVLTVFVVVDHDHIDLFKGEWEAILAWDPTLQRPYALKSLKPLPESQKEEKCFKSLTKIGKLLPNPSSINRDPQKEICYVLEGDEHDHEGENHPFKIITKVQLLLEKTYGTPLELIYTFADNTLETVSDDPQKIAVLWMAILERNEARVQEGKKEVPAEIIYREETN